MDSVVVSQGDLGAPVIAEILRQTWVEKYLFAAALTMLMYDHMLTFSTEVETIWKKKKTYPAIFFLTFRYYAPLAMVVVSIPFFSTIVTPERCRHWTLFYPLGVTFPLILFPSIVMLMRVYALYNRSKLILAGLSIILTTQTIFGIWQTAVSGNAQVPVPVDNYDFHVCLYAPKDLGRASEVFILMSLGYDTLVFFLTLGRTLYMYWRRQGRGPRSRSLLHHIVRDGALYFAAISSMNVFWTLVIIYAPPGLGGIAALPSGCVTAVVIGRITLNLRIVIYVPDDPTTNTDDIPLSALRARQPALDVGGRVAAASHPHKAAPASSIEDFDEGRSRHHSEPSEYSRSLRKMDPDA